MGAPALLHHLRGAGLVLTLTPAGGLHVAPRSAITDNYRSAIRAERDALVLALLAEAARSTPTCPGCRHRLRRGTCGEPVAAGLSSSFEIIWPPSEHAAACPAFIRAPKEQLCQPTA